jgi:murein DD-endopeptidase MepM/ murein hydrolase activator NlpD
MFRRFTPLPYAFAILGAATLFAARGQWPWQRLSDVPVALPIVVRDPFRVVSDTLHSGESISTLLDRQGVTGFDFSSLASLLHFDPRRLRAGLVFSVHRDVTTDLPTRIELQPDHTQRLRFIRTSSGWSGESLPIRWVTDTIRIQGVIETTLTEAADRAVAEATLDRDARAQFVNDLADVFAWSVDFSRDPQPGDPFTAVVERLASEDGEVRFGRVLAGDISINGRNLQAFRYLPGSGRPGYYDAEGNALRREFLVAPLLFRYITSGVTNRRFHPVLRTYRRHEGIDYSASTGTPVHSTANGTVMRAGRAGGYGNLVEIRHRNGIVTRYAHLSRITAGLRPGRSVMQGQEIGRVGSTGTSTAPHLHYEFRVNGVARDPRSMKFDAGEPLDRGDRPGFERDRDLLLQLLGRRAFDAPGTILTD